MDFDRRAVTRSFRGISQEPHSLNAASELQSTPEMDSSVKNSGRKSRKRRRLFDDPGKGFGNSVDSNGEIGGTRDVYANDVESNGCLESDLDVGFNGNVDKQRDMCFRTSVELNSSAEELGAGELVDVPIEMVDSKISSSLGDVMKIDVESVGFALDLDGDADGDEDMSVRGNTCDLTNADNVDSNAADLLLKEGYLEVGSRVLCEVETYGIRNRKLTSSTLNSPEEGSLRRSARRAKAMALAQINGSSNEVTPGTNDVSCSGIIVVSKEKLDHPNKEGVEESEALPPCVALPPSSKNQNLEGIPILDLFSVYACLRSFSALFYLSPFSLEDFVDSLKSEVANTLLDSVHVAILRTLRKHLEFLSNDGSESASICLRSLNWDLLDAITWPIFLVEYLLIHGSGLKSWSNIVGLKIVDCDYYKQPAGIKIAMLQCLCDDVIEADCILAELNNRISTSYFDADFNRNLKNVTLRKTRTCSEGADITGWNSDECCLCKMEGNLICCDGCPSAYHLRCVGVTSSLLPEGEWYCPECVISGCNSEIKLQNLIRGAEPLGADPYGRMYFHCCGYLLVSESCDADSSFNYYYKDDVSIVINALESHGFPCRSIANVITHRLVACAELDQPNYCSGSPSVIILEAVPKPTEHSICSNNGEEGNKRRSEGLGKPVTSCEGSAEVLQGFQPSQSCNISFDTAPPVSENADLSSVHLGLDNAGSAVKQRKRGRPPGVHHKASATEAPPMQDNTRYVNNYSFARIASSIAEEITPKPSDKINDTVIKSEKEIILTQLKTISKKSVKFCWPSFWNIHVDMHKEKCGWCYSCKSPDKDRDCLFNSKTASSVSEGFKAKLGTFQSKQNTRRHLVDIACCILSMEHRLQGLLLGPWLRPDHCQFFHKNTDKASDFAVVKHRLLLLESNLRPSALSANWPKHVDSARTMGSSSHVNNRTRVSSKSRVGKKGNILGVCGPTPVSIDGGLVMFWWRGGQVSRRLFNWKVLPRSLALKAARKGGSVKIPGLLYLDSSEHVKRSKQIAWRAAVEMSASVAQLALQVRELDLNIRWDEIENTHILSTLDKESQKSIKQFKKAVVRRKLVEGTMVKYLLDFGKRRFIPDVVQRHGSKVDDPACERKKYWLEESYLPLHLLRNFKDKFFAPKGGKAASVEAPYDDKAPKSLVRMKGLEYLFARAERSSYYQCGHCIKDVPISEAVSCHLCKGHFHKSHVREPSVSITDVCVYKCYNCEPAKPVQAVKKKEKVKILKIKSKKGTLSGIIIDKGQSKRERKLKDKHSQMLLRNSKRVQVPEHPPHASPKDNAIAGISLRRSARKVKCTSRYIDSAEDSHPEKWSISGNGKDGKTLNTPSYKKNRTRPLSTFWKNGLRLSRKQNDVQAADFKRRKLLISSKYAADLADQPKCVLCCEERCTPASKYISCEICGDWYHGDAFDLDTEMIQRLVGFRCHVCLKKSPPACPYFEDMTHCESLPGHDAKNAGTDPNEASLIQNCGSLSRQAKDVSPSNVTDTVMSDQ